MWRCGLVLMETPGSFRRRLPPTVEAAKIRPPWGGGGCVVRSNLLTASCKDAQSPVAEQRSERHTHIKQKKLHATPAVGTSPGDNLAPAARWRSPPARYGNNQFRGRSGPYFGGVKGRPIDGGAGSAVIRPSNRHATAPARSFGRSAPTLTHRINQLTKARTMSARSQSLIDHNASQVMQLASMSRPHFSRRIRASRV